MKDGEEDVTVLRVEIEGMVEGEKILRRWDLLDRYDRETGTSSMARTTGYTAAATINAVADGLFSEKGLSPPEIIGRNRECHNYIFDYLARRGVVFEVSEEAL